MKDKNISMGTESWSLWYKDVLEAMRWLSGEKPHVKEGKEQSWRSLVCCSVELRLQPWMPASRLLATWRPQTLFGLSLMQTSCSVQQNLYTNTWIEPGKLPATTAALGTHYSLHLSLFPIATWSVSHVFFFSGEHLFIYIICSNYLLPCLITVSIL